MLVRTLSTCDLSMLTSFFRQKHYDSLVLQTLRMLYKSAGEQENWWEVYKKLGVDLSFSL